MVSSEEQPPTSKYPLHCHVHCPARVPTERPLTARLDNKIHFRVGGRSLWPLPNTEADPEAVALALPKPPEEPFQIPHRSVVCSQPVLSKPGCSMYVWGGPWHPSPSRLHGWLSGRVLACGDFRMPSLGALENGQGPPVNPVLTGELGWPLAPVTGSPGC